MTTRESGSGSTAARRSFWAGLPPQSTRTAPLSPTKTRDVVSRSRPGTAPELPRKTKCTASGGGAGAGQEQRGTPEPGPPAVDGEPALPHGEDLSRVAPVVVEVEGDVVETRAHEPAEEPQLGGLEQTVGVDASPHGLAIGEPEARRHGAGHQDAVPAKGQGA